MTDGDPLLWHLLFQFILILINALFACAEIAIISMNDAKIQKLSISGDRRAMKLGRLTSQPANFLSTIQVGITLAGFLGSAFAAGNFSDRLVGLFERMNVPIPSASLDSISVIIITLILSYFTLVFGELVPKRIAMKKAEKLALALSGLIYFLSKVFSPVISLLTFSTNILLKLLGIDPHANEEEVTEEEIRMLLETGSENGTILLEESQMIKNVFEFNDKIAEDVMTHRIEVSILWMDESLEQWNQTILESKHSRYPVCDESTDDVVGVLNIKDYYRLKDLGFEAIKEQAVLPAYFIPEAIKTDILFKEMKRKRNHFAIVLDEYGGMSGIVTISDLIEEIVGEFDEDDHIDNQIPDIETIDSNTWKIRGSMPLDEVSEALSVVLPTEDYETFGGFIFGTLNSIPEDGSKPSLEAYGLNIKVETIKDHRVELAIVCKLEEHGSIVEIT